MRFAHSDVRTPMRTLTASIVACAFVGCAGAARPSAARPELRAELARVAASIDGEVAIAIVELATGAEVHVNGETPMPQQSTFKLWLAVAVADAVERGEVSWDTEVRIEPEQLTFPYQPIADEVGEGRAFTLAELVGWILLVSDNPSADAILRALGGTDAVEAALRRRGIEGVRITTGEEGLHAMADRLRSETDSMGEAEARAHLRAALARDPNGATALGAARGLARLARGELLDPASTERLIRHLAETETGAARLRAGLPEGWSVAHKTGTGPDLRGVGLGTNDVGVIRAPDGQRWAVAVFIAGTTAAPADREARIADVARAVVASHRARSTSASIHRAKTSTLGERSSGKTRR